MRLAVTIARLHGATTFQNLTGPEVPLATHQSAYKTICASPVNPTYAEVQVWESGRGKVKSHRFNPPPTQ